MEEYKEVYKNSLIELLNKELGIDNLDNIIEESNCLFRPSTTFEKYGYMRLSKYIYCLNSLYLENLDKIEEPTNEFIKSTIKTVITKKGVNNITYFNPTPETIIKNGTLVFAFIYGKNKEELAGDDYINNVKKQKEVISRIEEKLKKEVVEKFNIECKMLSYKIL